MSCSVKDNFIVLRWAVNLWKLLCQEMAMAENINSSRIVLNILMGAKAYCVIKNIYMFQDYLLPFKELPLGSG